MSGEVGAGKFSSQQLWQTHWLDDPTSIPLSRTDCTKEVAAETKNLGEFEKESEKPTKSISTNPQKNKIFNARQAPQKLHLASQSQFSTSIIPPQMF